VFTGFCLGAPTERDYLEDLGVGEFSIKMGLQKVGWGGIDWTDLALDGDKWQALVNTIINQRAT
jgi:hypothetical protein